jgi:hypothetical protein
MNANTAAFTGTMPRTFARASFDTVICQFGIMF